MHHKIQAFAIVALIEGISYLVLLGIAMPLKYFFDFPYAVTVVGWAHGVLFMLYVALLMLCWFQYKWSFVRVFKYFIASLLPVLPFIIEHKLRQEYSLKLSK
jgi:integral membrane protein